MTCGITSVLRGIATALANSVYVWRVQGKRKGDEVGSKVLHAPQTRTYTQQVTYRTEPGR